MTHGTNDYFGWQIYKASSAVGISFKRGYYKRSELMELIAYLTKIQEAMSHEGSNRSRTGD